MKKLVFLTVSIFLLYSGLSAQGLFGGKKEKKEETKQESNIQEEGKQNNGSKLDSLEIKPFKTTGLNSVDEVGTNSYNLAVLLETCKKEASFLTIETTEKNDPKLGTVTEVKCKNSEGKEIPCQGLDKAEVLRKLTAIIQKVTPIPSQIPGLQSSLKGASDEIKSAKSNPMKAVAAGKAATQLDDIAKLITKIGFDSGKLIDNLNKSIKALDLIKKQ